jgi:hypothetical protein
MAPAPTWNVTYRKNIGIIATHIRETTPMQVCRRCLHKEYWKRFLVLVTIGWTSYYSIVIGPVMLVLNTVQYARAGLSRPDNLPLPQAGPTPQFLPPIR